MTDRVVDTNVAVVANGRDVNASEECQLRAIELLEVLVERGRTVIDEGGQIFSEYGKRLYAQGQPGVGDMFFRHLLDSQGDASAVRKVDPNALRAKALDDALRAGGLARFDPADRIFAACSAVARAPVSLATDSDWSDHEVGLQACGVRVHYVCGKAAATKTPVPATTR